MMFRRLAVLPAILIVACASPEGSTNEEKLAYMGEFERATLAWLLEDHPDAEEKLWKGIISKP